MCLSHFAAYKKNDDFIYKKTKQSNILEGWSKPSQGIMSSPSIQKNMQLTTATWYEIRRYKLQNGSI